MSESAPSMWDTWFEWAVSQEVTGVLQWLGTAIAVVGIPLAIRQSWLAKRAAEQAKRAVTQFQRRLTSVNNAHAYSHLELARGFVVSQNFSAAVSVMGILKRNVLQSIEVLQSLEDPPPSIAQGRRNIARMEAQLTLAARTAPNYNPAALDGAMRGLGDCLIQWEQLILELGSSHG
jgi:hypothetical protein